MEFRITYLLLIIICTLIGFKIFAAVKYAKLEKAVLEELPIDNWEHVPYFDEYVIVKSRQALEKYDDVKFFKEREGRLEHAERVIFDKNEISKELEVFLFDNAYKSCFQYKKVKEHIRNVIINAATFRIKVDYVTSAGNNLASKTIELRKADIERFRKDPSLLMTKSEYNKYMKEQQKILLDEKHHKYYGKVNNIVDYANEHRDLLPIKRDREEIDSLVTQLFDRTVNSIKKIKDVNSEEWDIIENFISRIDTDMKKVVSKNKKILDYYKSENFLKVKASCEVLMSTQREFNEYINEKVKSISSLFGSRVLRNETTNSDVNNYIRPYKKTVTPFTAEVSATVFASAENNPLEYVVKNFYPNKSAYKEQIQKLYLLIEELETLREAKQIIENYKADYQQYLGDVPDYIMQQDEAGFYERLGFADIDESVLTVEYKFSYTSNGGMAQRSFTVPMTEETIINLIQILESKLTQKEFVKEQRRLMTKKMRESVKERDHFTCCQCGNSITKEPNLLLEIDHIIPVSKGGYTTEENLQTLCWKCNRSKSNKIIA